MAYYFTKKVDGIEAATTNEDALAEINSAMMGPTRRRVYEMSASNGIYLISYTNGVKVRYERHDVEPLDVDEPVSQTRRRKTVSAPPVRKGATKFRHLPTEGRELNSAEDIVIRVDGQTFAVDTLVRLGGNYFEGLYVPHDCVRYWYATDGGEAFGPVRWASSGAPEGTVSAVVWAAVAPAKSQRLSTTGHALSDRGNILIVVDNRMYAVEPLIRLGDGTFEPHDYTMYRLATRLSGIEYGELDRASAGAPEGTISAAVWTAVASL